MHQIDFHVTDKLGLHARPAGMLVKTLQPFTCDVTMTSNGKTVDGKKLFSVMSLGSKFGDIIQICCSGEDEVAAIEAITAFMEQSNG